MLGEDDDGWCVPVIMEGSDEAVAKARQLIDDIVNPTSTHAVAEPATFPSGTLEILMLQLNASYSMYISYCILMQPYSAIIYVFTSNIEVV